MSFQLDRRTFLRGSGVACALPFLECMTASASERPSAPPKRLCFVYFPNGVGLPPESSPHHESWTWFPKGQGESYELTRSLEPLTDFRADISILGGLSHPLSRRILGHAAGDTWLTGGDVRGSSYKNSISVDQLAARQLGQHTRFPSLSLSTDGGVGYKSRVSTLSFDANGRPLPSEHRQRAIFERYFAPAGGATTQQRRKSLQKKKKIVDLIMEDSRRMKRKLGHQDNQTIEQYMSALSTVEGQVARDEKWLDVPMPELDASQLNLNTDATVNPETYVRATIDLMVLGFQTDLTRVMTYMMAREDGMGFGENFPNLALGIPKGHHSISHDKSKDHWVEWGRYDAWLASQFAYLLKRLKETHDEHGPLLDNTLVLYGSACSSTHNARNYPLVLAGGNALGVQHGSYRVFDEKDTPLSNLFVSMMKAVGLPLDSFADSTGELPTGFGQ